MAQVIVMDKTMIALQQPENRRAQVTNDFAQYQSNSVHKLPDGSTYLKLYTNADTR